INKKIIIFQFLFVHCQELCNVIKGRRKILESSLQEIGNAILMELQGSKRIRNVYKLKVRQKVVIRFLKELDPEGVEARSRYKLKRRVYEVPGPNYLWHADNHDKLKRFGFAIYGCIDAIIRTDNGTEATLMEDLNKSLRWKDTDENAGHKSFLRGKSTHNQRTESFWRRRRRRQSNKFDIECLRYCFGPLIEGEISFVIKEWNEHKISKQNSRDILEGIPNELNHWPEKYGARDYKRPVKEECLQSLLNDYTKFPIIYSKIIEEIVNLILPNPASNPCTVEDAYDLYIKIKNIVKNYII
ncbi:hypothetical protein TSAR_000877, partial [Trichomalopsis sarcophagae]